MERRDLISKISFAVFVSGFCSLLIEIIYEERSEILKEMSNTYFSIVNMGKAEMFALIIGIITLISLTVYIMSISIEVNK